MLFDLHNDFPTALDYGKYSEYLSDKCDIAKITAVIWTSAFDRNALAVVTDLTSKLSALPGTIPIALEDIGFSAERDIYKSFDFSRYLYCSLTWNNNNAFAGGAMDDGMLTRDGRLAVQAINACGCAVDLAHLNKNSFYAVLDVAEFVLCSHTGFNNHPRSLDDGMIRALTDRNALIGLCAVTAFTDAKDARAFSDVIDRFVQKYGIDCLALGTDFMGSDDIPKDMASYEDVAAAVDMLKSRGYTRGDIDKILYKNALRFYNRRFKL